MKSVSTIGEGQNICSMLLDREIAVNASISSSVIANSTACRHFPMMPLLVQPIANEESANKSFVP